MLRVWVPPPYSIHSCFWPNDLKFSGQPQQPSLSELATKTYSSFCDNNFSNFPLFTKAGSILPHPRGYHLSFPVYPLDSNRLKSSTTTRGHWLWLESMDPNVWFFYILGTILSVSSYMFTECIRRRRALHLHLSLKFSICMIIKSRNVNPWWTSMTDLEPVQPIIIPQPSIWSSTWWTRPHASWFQSETSGVDIKAA